MRGDEDTFATLVTLGCLACAGLFVLIAWDGTHALPSSSSSSHSVHLQSIHSSIYLGIRLREVDLAPVGAFDGIKSEMFSTEDPTNA